MYTYSPRNGVLKGYGFGSKKPGFAQASDDLFAVEAWMVSFVGPKLFDFRRRSPYGILCFCLDNWTWLSIYQA